MEGEREGEREKERDTRSEEITFTTGYQFQNKLRSKY